GADAGFEGYADWYAGAGAAPGWHTPAEYPYPAGQVYCANAALDVPPARTAAIAKTLTLVGITTSARHAKERQSTACSGERCTWKCVPAPARPDRAHATLSRAARPAQARYDAGCEGAHPRGDETRICQTSHSQSHSGRSTSC